MSIQEFRCMKCHETFISHAEWKLTAEEITAAGLTQRVGVYGDVFHRHSLRDDGIEECGGIGELIGEYLDPGYRPKGEPDEGS